MKYDFNKVQINKNLILYYVGGKLSVIERPLDNTKLLFHSNGRKEWYKNGQLHRDNDLPAVEHANGKKEWWKNGKFIRKSLSNNYLENIGISFK